MKICHCALPALSGNNECCKNCMNDQEYEMFPKTNITTTNGTEITSNKLMLVEVYHNNRERTFTKIIG